MATDYDARRYATRYVRTRGLTESAVRDWSRRLVERVPADEVDVVVDVASGAGRFWPSFAAAWHPRAVMAIDGSLAMLKAAGRSPGVMRIVADIDSLPVRPGSADVVFCSMAVHYSEDPRECVRRMARLARADGALLLRTGSHATLPSFDFLRFFPRAEAAELRAMPSTSELLRWLDVPELEVLRVDVVRSGGATTRRAAIRMVARRGFPSLQLVTRGELIAGAVRYSLHLFHDWTRRVPRPLEQSVLVSARRRS